MGWKLASQTLLGKTNKRGKICLASLLFLSDFLPAWFYLVTLICPHYKKVMVLAFVNQERGCLGRSTSGCWPSRIPAHTRPYLAANGQTEEIPLNWKSLVFLLLWKAPSTCSWQNSLQHFLFSFFPVCLLPFPCHSVICCPDPKPLSPCPSQGKASGAA